jgi:hypothetical protein
MFTKWWNELPHQAQAAIVALGGGMLGVLEPVVQHWASGQVVCSIAVGPCMKEYAVSALRAGVLAVIGLYIQSSYHK